jgi:hypothetical protein
LRLVFQSISKCIIQLKMEKEILCFLADEKQTYLLVHGFLDVSKDVLDKLNLHLISYSPCEYQDGVQYYLIKKNPVAMKKAIADYTFWHEWCKKSADWSPMSAKRLNDQEQLEYYLIYCKAHSTNANETFSFGTK